MKIATYNANSIRLRMPLILKWLATHQPDVLCVQETKVQDHDFPKEAIESAGYQVVFKGQKSYNGVAILSKHPLKNVACGLDDSGPADEPRLITAVVGKVAIVNTYVPQGYLPDSDKYAYKLEWFKRLRSYFERHFKPTDMVVWVGDLNVAPEAIDVHDPVRLMGHVCFNPQVTAALYDVMAWGFTDVFRQHCKEAGQYSFWDYRMPGTVKHNLGWRLDLIMATKPLAKKSLGCSIDKEPRTQPQPSDHTFVVAEFDV
ncbi:MAG: exodeoxyribonuclease III [Sedimentisphaerales bacterium]|nr:exodeoxyribonuclease III [Sedimentisphaerales bacterium]